MESETMAETHIHVYINERVYKTQLFMQFKKNWVRMKKFDMIVKVIYKKNNNNNKVKSIFIYWSDLFSTVVEIHEKK